ncbi:MAG TPA: hypothetical protein G4O02_02740 [Caldilineae bacterium]|jgi:hypothetical protein|nr:hypothetical protein [Caldilineae bacterium]
MRNPDWDECRTCKGRDLCHGEGTLAGYGMSGQLFHELATHDAEARAFFERRADELLELQRLTNMDTRWMILHGLLNGAVWALSRRSEPRSES